MNRGKYQQDIHRSKKIRKEVKKAKADTILAESLSQKPFARKTPIHCNHKDRAIINTVHHQMTLKKGRVNAKHSRRTTPGESIDKLFAPPVAYRESKQWLKTIIKQSVNHAKRLTRKIKKAFR